MLLRLIACAVLAMCKYRLRGVGLSIFISLVGLHAVDSRFGLSLWEDSSGCHSYRVFRNFGHCLGFLVGSHWRLDSILIGLCLLIFRLTATASRLIRLVRLRFGFLQLFIISLRSGEHGGFGVRSHRQSKLLCRSLPALTGLAAAALGLL